MQPQKQQKKKRASERGDIALLMYPSIYVCVVFLSSKSLCHCLRLLSKQNYNRKAASQSALTLLTPSGHRMSPLKTAKHYCANTKQCCRLVTNIVSHHPVWQRAKRVITACSDLFRIAQDLKMEGYNPAHTSNGIFHCGANTLVDTHSSSYILTCLMLTTADNQLKSAAPNCLTCTPLAHTHTHKHTQTHTHF